MNISIGDKKIGDGQPAHIIAELSCNHLQNFDLAIKTIEAIKDSGADSVKVQVYTPDTMTLNSDKKYFRINHGTIWDGTTLYKLYQEAYTPWDWIEKLQKVAEKLGLAFFASAFDESAVDLLEKIDVPAYKVASFEIRDIPLIKYMAKQGKPMIISTGIATLPDIERAVKACHQVNNRQVIILKCTSAYPTPLDEVNLLTLADIKKRFKKIVGISDHTLGELVPTVGIALGAKVIEKHFILDRKLGGPDGPFSMEPAEFKAMVTSVRQAEIVLGEPTYQLTKTAKKGRTFGRSIFAVQDIRRGEKFTSSNVKSIRPGYGLSPELLPKVLGKKAKRNLERGTPLKMTHIK